MTPRTATEHDVYMGERIREARIAKGMKMAELASMIGVAYQQLQKYESGANRVPAGRVSLLVTILNRPLSYFYPSATDVRAAPTFSALLAIKEGQQAAELLPLMSPPDRALWIKIGRRLVEASP